MNRLDNGVEQSVLDAALIRRVKKGDRDAAEELLRTYSSGIFDFLLSKLRQVEDAEDAAQETMIKVLRGIARYEERGQFKAWLYCIAQREALQVIRRRQTLIRRKTENFVEITDSEQIASADRGPAECLVGRERLEGIRGEVDRLPVNERRVFLMRAEEGLSFAKIAAMMECPINTALGRMRNASLKLRRWLRSSEACR